MYPVASEGLVYELGTPAFEAATIHVTGDIQRFDNPTREPPGNLYLVCSRKRLCAGFASAIKLEHHEMLAVLQAQPIQ
jgi:hypothetical protein